MKRHFLIPILALAAGTSLLACGCGAGGSPAGSGSSGSDKVESASPATSDAASDQATAEKIFETRCATCHGKEGLGDGPGATALNPKPRNFHDLEWQKATSDSTIETAIVYGGAAVGRSAAMVPNPDLQAKPGVVKALRAKVRSFGK
jgi:mono/diheme cytochrome c family protein